MFNGILIAYFLVALIKDRVLPDLPLSLVGLTGTGAATYVANKAVERSQAKITRVVHIPPTVAGSVSQLRIHGAHLLAGRAREKWKDQISVSGAKVDNVAWFGETLIDVTLDRQLTGTAVSVVVVTAAGTTVIADAVTLT